MSYATQNRIDYDRMLDRVRTVERDYSQSGEQAAIIEALAACDPFGSWRFLDIGAGDGETFSNSRALALAGWNGVMVEPAAWAFEKLVELYAWDKGDRFDLVSAVVTPLDDGLRRFYYSSGDHLSTTSDRERRKWASVSFASTWAATISLDELLSHVLKPAPSVVSIDAEGMTNELVRAYARLPEWEAVEVICYEREDFARAGATWLAEPFRLVAETSNNLIYRRQR